MVNRAWSEGGKMVPLLITTGTCYLFKVIPVIKMQDLTFSNMPMNRTIKLDTEYLAILCAEVQTANTGLSKEISDF